MSNDTSRADEMDAERDTAVEEAFRKVNGAGVPDSDAIWDTLYALYDAGFGAGRQDEYSYPS